MPTSDQLLQRRRHPRIEIDGVVTAQDLTTGAMVVIRDISIGGFKTESPREAVVGHLHIFRVSLPGRGTCMLRATVVHCQAKGYTRPAHIVGWRAESDLTTAESLRRLIEAVTTLDPILADDAGAPVGAAAPPVTGVGSALARGTRA